MKILYIANERRDAQVGAAGLHDMAPNVTVLWTSRFDHAAKWIQEERDLAAVVVEVQRDSAGCSSFLTDVRRVAEKLPVIVVASEEVTPDLRTLKAAADDYLERSQSLPRELPGVVTRAIERRQACEGSAKQVSHKTSDQRSRAQNDEQVLNASVARAALALTLAEAQAALDRAGRASASDAAAAADRLAQCQAEFGAKIADAIESKSRLERRLTDLEASVRQREKGWVVERSAAAERRTKLEDLVHQERATRGNLEQELARAKAALEDAEQRHQSATKTAATQLAERQAQYEVAMARAAATWDMVDEQLREAAIQVKRARTDQAAAAADVERLSRCEVELTSQLAEAVTALEAANARAARDQAAALERAAQRDAELQAQLQRETEKRHGAEEKLAQSETARDVAEKRTEASKISAAALLAERETRFDRQLAEAVTARNTLDHQVRELGTALDRARQELASATALVQQLTGREEELNARLADAAAAHNALELQLASAVAARKDTDERAARERMAADARAAEREAELDALLKQERAAHERLGQALAQAEAALRDAEQRHASELTTGAAALAERQAQFDARLTESAAANDGLKQRLTDAHAALERARQDRASAAAEVDRLTQREAELAALLTDATATRAALERRLAGTESAFNDADRERLAAARKAAEREAELDGLIRQERATRVQVEQALAQAEAALRDAEQRHASTMTSAAAALAERQSQFDVQLTAASAARDAHDERARDFAAALDHARHEVAATAAEVERLTEREVALSSQLTEAAEARHVLERQLTDAATATKNAEQRAAREQVAAAARQTDVESRLAREIELREGLEREIARTRSAAAEAERSFREETAAVNARAREEAARLENQLAVERTGHESRLAETNEQVQRLALERDGLHESLRMIQEQSQRLAAKYREERENLERAHSVTEAKIQRLVAEHAEVQRSLEDARRDFQQTLDRTSSEHAAALARLASSVSERDAVIEDQAARNSAALQAAEGERARLQGAFQATLADRGREIEQLQDRFTTALQELNVTKGRRDVLQTQADLVPQLQKQLDESQAEARRQFDHVPLALCRCSRGGVLTHANRAFAELVGYRKADDLRGTDFVATIFETPEDLARLIERSVTTHARESVETTWKRINGGRVVVRLSAFASSTDVIEIVAEDLTHLRGLQDRLGQAHRMEAVGRLASEVAVTCGNLLKDVHQNAQQWLLTAGGDTAVRQKGEMLLEEVTRAAGFLRQLAAYGEEETSALAPVDLNRVLRDLEPVLKRVAGDDVELELPKGPSPVNVDVTAECAERLLVNLAGYGRERMPFGGRLVVDLATIVVDRKFIEQYPNCRPGPHALITVTEIRRPMPGGGPLQLRDETTKANGERSAPKKPGVDLGVLQALIRECNGHLWMTVEPPGNMVAKIHLPLRLDESAQATAPVARKSRGRAVARWFQH